MLVLLRSMVAVSVLIRILSMSLVVIILLIRVCVLVLVSVILLMLLSAVVGTVLVLILGISVIWLTALSTAESSVDLSSGVFALSLGLLCILRAVLRLLCVLSVLRIYRLPAVLLFIFIVHFVPFIFIIHNRYLLSVTSDISDHFFCIRISLSSENLSARCFQILSFVFKESLFSFPSTT